MARFHPKQAAELGIIGHDSGFRVMKDIGIKRLWNLPLWLKEVAEALRSSLHGAQKGRFIKL